MAVPWFNNSKGITSEFLNKKRPLTLNMIRTLSRELNIPIEVLVQDYELNGRPNKELAHWSAINPWTLFTDFGWVHSLNVLFCQGELIMKQVLEPIYAVYWSSTSEALVLNLKGSGLISFGVKPVYWTMFFPSKAKFHFFRTGLE